MERYLQAEKRKQLTEIADQWRRTEDKTNQNRVLQSLNNYAKVFLSRLEKPQYVYEKDNHGASFISQNSSEVKTGNGTETNTADTICRTNLIPETTESMARPDQEKCPEPKIPRPDVCNSSMVFRTGETEDMGLSGDRNEKLESILQIGHDTITLEELIPLIDQYLICSGEDYSRPTYFGTVPGSGHLLYSAADFLASIAHLCPVSRLENAVLCDVEQSVLRWLSDIIGYPEQARGVTVSGTSMGTIVAFSAARHVKLPDSSQITRSVVYMTDHAHFCHTKALRIVGLKDVVMKRVPTRKYRMDANKLEEMITADYKAGLRPFMMVGIAGDTSLGAVDPLRAMSQVAQRHGLWFHVDAAIGGILMLDESVKKKCDGINMADSVATDFHKALSAPFGTAAVLVRNGSHLKRAMARQSSPYFPALDEQEEYSPVDFSLEVTRPFRAFPVWFLLKILGIDMIKMAITEKVQLTKYAHKSISDLTNVITCMEPDLTVIAFRYVPTDSKDGNDVTRKWHKLIVEEGQVSLTPTTVDGLFYIRLCILSFRSHIEAVDTALASIKRNLDRLG